jgi:hypothetical protein
MVHPRRGTRGPDRPSSPPPPPLRRIPGRSSTGPDWPGPAFVAVTPAVAAHPGPEPLGAWLARPGLHHRHLRRRGASRAGAARCPDGPAGAPSRRIPGGWPGPAFVAAAPALAAQLGPEPPGARLVRPGLIVRPGLLLLTLRFVIRCAIASSVWANGRTQQDRASGEGAGAAGSRGSLALSGRERREAEQGVTRSLTSLSRHAS